MARGGERPPGKVALKRLGSRRDVVRAGQGDRAARNEGRRPGEQLAAPQVRDGSIATSTTCAPASTTPAGGRRGRDGRRRQADPTAGPPLFAAPVGAERPAADRAAPAGTRYSLPPGAHSSAGRASASRAEGHRFEPCCAHQSIRCSGVIRDHFKRRGVVTSRDRGFVHLQGQVLSSQQPTRRLRNGHAAALRFEVGSHVQLWVHGRRSTSKAEASQNERMVSAIFERAEPASTEATDDATVTRSDVVSAEQHQPSPPPTRKDEPEMPTHGRGIDSLLVLGSYIRYAIGMARSARACAGATGPPSTSSGGCAGRRRSTPS